MEKKIALLFLALFTGLVTGLMAQGLQVTGKVTSKVTGEALANATVSIQGTNQATKTDEAGNFVINIPDGSTRVLVITYAGMASQQVTVSGSGPVHVALDLQASVLNEVVVVGYGTQQKRALTTAVSSVKAKDLENLPVFRVEQSLQGRVSGVTITQNSGQPGDAARIRVRGTTTLWNSDPLFIVDGVKVGGGIEYLNQSDIESIEVLKDAAAAAIYGAQAASGVILVTTKKGKRGSMSVNYNGHYGVQQAWRKLDLLNAEQYATLLNEARVAAGMDMLFANPKALGEGTNWQDAVFNDKAPVQNHELSLSGGSDRSTYYASFGLLDQDGIVASSNSYFKRFTARFNSTHKITNAITFGTNIGYTRIKSRGVGTNDEWGSPLGRAINIDPITPLVVTDPVLRYTSPYDNPLAVKDENGNPYGISNLVSSEIVNPVAALKTSQGNGWSDKVVGNGYIEIEPIKGLRFKSTIGADLAFWGDRGFQPLFYLNPIVQNTQLNGFTRNNNRGLFWVWENTLSYNRKFGAHDVTGLIGSAAQKNYGETQGGTKRGIPVDHIDDASLNFPVPQTNQYFWGGEYEDALSSLFARANYNYNGKYLLSALVRRDGSSRFGSNNKYGFFPSVSAGWVASQENFFPANTVVSFLKFRGSYGITGNDRIGDFRYLSTVSGGRNYLLNGVLYNGVSPNALSNPDLKWEETSQMDVGFDAVLFRNFNLTVDYFTKKTTGMLMGISVPGYVGNGGPTGNIADMENKGVEMELGYRRSIGELDLNISSNATYVQNEVVYLGAEKKFEGGLNYGTQNIPVTRHYIGQPFGSLYGYKTAGLFQNDAEVKGYVNKDGQLIQPEARPGDIRFVDLNNDGKINEDDRTIIGDHTPDWTFGFTASAAWKGFDVLLFGQGVMGNEVLQLIRRFDLPTTNWTTRALGRWTGEGSSTDFPRLVLDDPNKNFSRISDFFVEKGDYFRVKTLQIGYTLPVDKVKKVGLSKVRVYVTGNNLLTFTNYSGFDPEITGGVDRGIYPQARAYLVGLNLGF